MQPSRTENCWRYCIIRDKDFWEKTAEKFGKNGIRAVCSPTSTGLFNIYGDLLERTALIPFLKNLGGLRVLDLGCGVGRWSSRLLDYGVDVVGIDISRNMIYEAKKRLWKGDHGERDELTVCCVSNLPFRDCSFDVCLSVKVLHHVTKEDKFKKAILELARVCRIEGRILILEASPQNRKPTSLDFPTVFRSTGEWIGYFKKTGLKIKRLKGVNLSIFLRPLVELKKKIVKDAEIYQYELRGKSRSETSVQKATKLTYYATLNMAIVLSLPFDIFLRNLFKNRCLHKLFILRKPNEDFSFISA